MIRDAVQEFVELGARGTAFRIFWELKTRGGSTSARTPEAPPVVSADRLSWTSRLPFADRETVADYMRDTIATSRLSELNDDAQRAGEGTIRAFGAWEADYGRPIQWHRNPVSGESWDASKFWSRALTDESRAGDVKLAWEIGRFPHFYQLARAATFASEWRERAASIVWDQIASFEDANPYEFGIHWNSGQEIAIRQLAWMFAVDVTARDSSSWDARTSQLADNMRQAAGFIGAHIDYARIAVYNNHILAEALALYVHGLLFGSDPYGRELRDAGRRILAEEITRQFYADGAYIQLSHNYHRVALQYLLVAAAFARQNADAPPPGALDALGRSVDFLVAHQNHFDGRLPNYGSNDGALPLPLTSCDYSDFRPTLQAASIVARGERLYDRGPWDEEAAWLAGPLAVDQAPLRKRARKSVSIMPSGFHVLRAADGETFAAFRCGSVRDRFSQIDMLHVDFWWRGENVLVDAGSYLYNGPAEWHEHFFRTASHNTVAVDGQDQMLHFRRFKVLYLTKAHLLRFEAGDRMTVATGEHYGYSRLEQPVIHRRSIAMMPDGVAFVIDRLLGDAVHEVALHWLGGPYPYEFSARDRRLTLATPHGAFGVTLFGGGPDAVIDVVAGGEQPPRGWLSRYYAERVAVPSLISRSTAQLPLELVSVLGPDDATVEQRAGGYRIGYAGRFVEVDVSDGDIRGIREVNGA